MRRVIILGSTGSIGVQTLEVIEHLNALHEAGKCAVRHEVVGLAVGRNAIKALQQRERWPAARVAVATANTPVSGTDPGSCLLGPDSAERLVREVDADVIVAAMVGFAGLPATLAAIELGRTVALANKETLVAAGRIMTESARRSGAKILPVDSEHSGLWQCLAKHPACQHASAEADDQESGALAPPLVVGSELARGIITASGGPFLHWTKERIDSATPAQALNHPRWSMGPKVTIDSASLMNKALELIEAHWLFGLEPERLGVLVHPQSIIHAIAQWRDGSMIAHLSPTSMHIPIQASLAYPFAACDGSMAKPLDLAALGKLEFQEPDLERFPSLSFGYEAIRRGGTTGVVLSAVNEEAVTAFLDGRISFGRIAEVVREGMDALAKDQSPASLDEVCRADEEARAWARRRLGLTTVPSP